MRTHTTILFGVAVLLGLAFAGKGACKCSKKDETRAKEPECAELSLPNFLNLGKCLKKSGDLCSANIKDIGTFVYKLGQCTFLGLRKLDAGTQLYMVQEFLKYLLERNYLEVALPALMEICDRLSSVLSAATANLIDINCEELTFDTEAVCGDPIVISISTTTPFATCLNDTGLICVGDTPVDEPAAVGFLRVLACLLVNTVENATTAVTKTLGCGLIAILTSLLGGAGSSRLKPLLCAVQSAIDIKCISC